MNHQDRITANSAFWREMLDQLPSSVFLFRIDESEDAKLFFVNKQLVNLLGFKPEEYVLGSESDGFIAKELKVMVDEIAGLSHSQDAKRVSTTKLTSKDGSLIDVRFYFRLFKPKSSTKPFISVSLIHDLVDTSLSPSLSNQETIFVAESTLMQNLLSRIEETVVGTDYLYLWGEKGTGKKTLIRRTLQTLDALGKKPVRAEISFQQCRKTVGDVLKKPVEDIIGEPEILILIRNFEGVNKAHIYWLDEVISTRTSLNMATRVFITSKKTLEQLTSEAKLPNEFIFKYPFISTAVPPLRYRKEDIRIIINKWFERFRPYLPESTEIDDLDFSRFDNYDWKGNFTELYAQLSQFMGEQIYTNVPKAKKDESSVKILPFDEMCARYLADVLKTTDGKIYGKGGAAELLDMKPTTLQSKLKKLNVK